MYSIYPIIKLNPSSNNFLENYFSESYNTKSKEDKLRDIEDLLKRHFYFYSYKVNNGGIAYQYIEKYIEDKLEFSVKNFKEHLYNLYQTTTYIPILKDYFYWAKFMCYRLNIKDYEASINIIFNFLKGLPYTYNSKISSNIYKLKSETNIKEVKDLIQFNMLDISERLSNTNSSVNKLKLLVKEDFDKVQDLSTLGSNNQQTIFKNSISLLQQCLIIFNSSKIESQVLTTITKIFIGYILISMDWDYKREENDLWPSLLSIRATNNTINNYLKLSEGEIGNSHIEYIKKIFNQFKEDNDLSNTEEKNICRRLYLLYDVGIYDGIFSNLINIEEILAVSTEAFQHIINFLHYKVFNNKDISFNSSFKNGIMKVLFSKFSPKNVKPYAQLTATQPQSKFMNKFKF
ncbi:hypothetical protein CONCODRAFT_74579 [Conidiobolus coronatus NRRL 28638]|uniref:Uncharacterized protein n=1 Tax=Conidiobolus coronatus (strain ATCC 28846 / CBS 209.66 / NRRL 28638) TaxID=796925 RepID=A0A137NQ44_CONC2|nr:hypothetical protein CONCODRAFT_74579 [Conidiobolus coronatus NRRL 28638]|eukprot:KXN64868.1 hypothetical protein CONCODRAFT_74579 [Conidiobolus coronatus NRRL 28638]